MKRLIIIFAAVAVVMTSCYEDPYADFKYSPKDPVAGEDIYFENMSYDAESFQWEFGDGYGSPAYDPIHSFASAGTYTVTLKAFGGNSGFDVAYATINVTSVDPYADFYITTDLPFASGTEAIETDMIFVGEQVTFNNTSIDAASVLWEFGDDYTSTEDSPSYSYDTPGTYTVTLHAYGFGDEISSYPKTIEVVEGINSTIRITVLEVEEDYPVENASVLLYPTLQDWIDTSNATDEAFTTALGKCIFEGMNEQRYYVDVYEDWHDNYTLYDDYGVDYIETQILEPGYIHDFFAYVTYYGGDKKMVLKRMSKKEILNDKTNNKKAAASLKMKENRFSKER
ncbi:PKD domain-containing protein [Bacteroidota bacterium]